MPYETTDIQLARIERLASTARCDVEFALRDDVINAEVLRGALNAAARIERLLTEEFWRNPYDGLIEVER